MRLQKWLIFILLISGSAWGEICDVDQSGRELQQYKEPLLKNLNQRFLADEEFVANIQEYVKRVNSHRQCQRIHQQELKSCLTFSLDLVKHVTSSLTVERSLLLDGDREGVSCFNDDNDVFFIIRNATGRQMFSYNNGMNLTHSDFRCHADDGLSTTRGFIFVNGEKSDSVSSVFAIDFADPMDDHGVSQFWGISLPVGKSRDFVTRSYADSSITYTWTNGAFVKMEAKEGRMVESNFLDSSVYNQDCLTEHSKDPGSARRYWPQIRVYDKAKSLVGKPQWVKSRSTSHAGYERRRPVNGLEF